MAFVNLKNEMEIFEFEPNQIITFRKLASAGITREDLQAFCDEAADFVENGTYFSAQSIKKAGFESELFDLGFSDWFYATVVVLIGVSMFWLPEGIALVVYGLCFVQAKLRDILDCA